MSNPPAIFLVEDEESLLSLYTVALQAVGSVQVASTAEDAMANLDALTQLPDIILLDLIIPERKGAGLDFVKRWGFEVLSHIMQSAQLKHVPVVVMTNLDETEDRVNAKQLGAVEYVVKSNIVPKDIVALVHQYINN